MDQPGGRTFTVSDAVDISGRSCNELDAPGSRTAKGAWHCAAVCLTFMSERKSLSVLYNSGKSGDRRVPGTQERKSL
jgi:hypothetical protein